MTVPIGDTDYGDTPHGWIQWKETDVCINLHCPCGYHGHVDGEFFYVYRCRCGQMYTVGANVKLIPIVNPTNNDIECAQESSL